MNRNGKIAILRVTAAAALTFVLLLAPAVQGPWRTIAGSADAAAQARQIEPSVFFAGRIAGNIKSTRIWFDIDKRLEFTSFLMDAPERLVIDAPAILFRFAEPADLEPRGLVSFLRYGAIARDRSRIVVSLAAPAKVTDIALREVNGGQSFRLVIDLAAVDRAEFERLVSEQQQLDGKSNETVIKGDRPRATPKAGGRFRIVIDPGHGGIDSGAIGVNGAREKDLTLKLSLLIAEKIRKAGSYEVELTRDEDVFLSLSERVDFSRRVGADLLISVHADSLRQKWVRGAAVYTLSNTASDDLAEQLAESENMTDIVAGLDNPAEVEAVTGILAELIARETKLFSQRFSATLVRFLKPELNMLKNPQRSASFVVLKAPEVPGVLVELGYLSNPEDEKMMSDPEWQDQAAGLIADAVESFFERRIR
jgi:N-acetylmuramoyl-L-alanine amidase